MISDYLEVHIADWLLRKTSKGAVRRLPDIPIVVASSVGLVRTENQDRVVVMRFAEESGEHSILIAVCDGMGGMIDGAACAAKALASFFATFRSKSPHHDPKYRLQEAAYEANEKIYGEYRGSGGATLSAVLLQIGCPAHWVNVGDSRIYSYGGRSLEQITVDDTLAGQLARESSYYEGRSELLQFIGVGPMIEPHVGQIETDEHTAVLITTDGVHFLPLNIMRELLTFATDPAIAARRLMDLAIWCGGHDNSSLAIIYPHEALNLSEGGRPDVVEMWDSFGEIRISCFQRMRPRHEVGAKAFNGGGDLQANLATHPALLRVRGHLKTYQRRSCRS